MRYISLFSGIEAASVAWEPLGWEPVAFCEFAPFPSAVLAHRFPNVPNLGDITKVDWSPYRGTVDVVVGGSPCQSFSVAGLRKGLADPRGNLLFEYLRAIDGVRPRWLVYENVPGLLSADGGRAFGSLLGGLAQLGYGFAYRVLDAQYVRVESHPRAVPQRRRRVFVVGHLGDWRAAAAVLLERESLCGHPAPRREAGAGAAPSPEGGAGDHEPRCRLTTFGRCTVYEDARRCDGTRDDCDGFLPERPSVAHTLRTEYDASEDGTGRGTPLVAAVADCPQTTSNDYSRADGFNIVMAPAFSKRPGQQIATRDDGSSFALTGGAPPSVLTDGRGFEAVAVSQNQRGELRTSDAMSNIGAGGGKPGQGYPAVFHRMAVRRLTPLEVERLQGFPDDWTLVPWRGKPAPDGKRYAAVGNSMAVNVMRWLGERIQAVEENAPATCEGAPSCESSPPQGRAAR